MCRDLLLILVVAALGVSCQDCPSNPTDVCGGCIGGDWDAPVFSQRAISASDSTCNVMVSWEYPNAAEMTSPSMVFVCSYTNGSYCDIAEIDICASCESMTLTNLDLNGDPILVYSDTCGNIETIPIIDDCEITTTTTSTSIDPSTTSSAPTTTSTPSTTTLSPGLNCQGAFEDIGGRCLFVDPLISTRWDEARFFCSEFQAELASLDNDELYLAVLDYLQTNDLNTRSYWLGGSDRFTEGIYVWLSGKDMEMGTPYWAVNNEIAEQEPTDVGKSNFDCIHMDGERFLYYDDADCLSFKAVICEKTFE